MINAKQVSVVGVADGEAPRGGRKRPPEPCLCQAIGVVLILGRFSGLSPIKTEGKKPHARHCLFVVSKIWMAWTCFILLFFIPYALYVYGDRLTYAPAKLQDLEWYVVTFGYIITDIESIVSLLTGAIFAKSSCCFMEHLSSIGGVFDKMKRLKVVIMRLVVVTTPCVLCVFASYIYVAWLRTTEDCNHDDGSLVDKPFAVIIRGLTLMFPSIETMIIITMTTIISLKFDNLAESTSVAVNACVTTGNADLLEEVSKTHIQITASLNNFNKYFGVQMLIGIATSLYTTIYYLYSFCESKERVHYLLGILYRALKLLIYLVLGHNIISSSQKPLESLLNTHLINVPTRQQEQIRTLILTWHNRHAALSGLGVVNIGPWLLAPIIGNVITYLLVALQFKNNPNNIRTTQNATDGTSNNCVLQ